MKFDWKRSLRHRLASKAAFRRNTPRKGRRNQPINTERLEERSLLSAISVIAADPFATEGESTGAFVFSRDGDVSQSLDLDYSLSGSASAGIDYAALAGSLTIPAGAATASLVVNPLEDANSEGNESVTLTLNAVAGHTLALDSATVTIRDEFDGAGVDALVPLSETFSLNSLPAARHTIYLDFLGGTVSGTDWIGGGDINVTPFNIEGGTGFSNNELSFVQQTWEIVAEDFRAFSVNVTTEEPNIEKLRNTGGGDQEWGITVMIGDPTNYNVGATGRAHTDSFSGSFNDVAWVDVSTVAAIESTPRAFGGLASHEVGHTLGLDHDGGSPGGEYYEGHGNGETHWSTIMGNVFNNPLVTWSDGSYSTADNSEDDLAIITTQNGFGYRDDDHADSAANATSLVEITTGVLLGEGNIETTSDFDLFSFTTTGGAFDIFVDPTSLSPNVDLGAELFDGSMNLIASNSVTDELSASLNQTLAAGTYYVRVTGTGNRTWSTNGYDDYASLGAYSVQVAAEDVVVLFSDVASFVPNAGQDQAAIVGTSELNDVTLSTLTKNNVSGGTNPAATWPLNWSGSSSQNLSEYISFTATPDAGRVLDLNELSVEFGYFLAGATAAIRTSVDGFSSNIDGTRAMSSGYTTQTFDVSTVADSNSSVEFRVYVWGGGAGWRDLDSLNLNGRTIADGPQPPAAPVANNDSANTGINQAATIDVLANDTDANGDVLTVSSVASQPTSGSVVINTNNTITYTPNTGFTGTDSFTYIATDGGLSSNTATVTITVEDPNASIRFAMLGDFGNDSTDEANVAAMVAAQNAEFVVTAGDNRYGSLTYQQAIGNHYSQYLPAVSGGTSTDNRFFPSPGNHDYNDGGGISEYLAYFDLPGTGTTSTNTSGSERYYDVIEGPVHFFLLDSDEAIGSSSDRAAQQNWLQTQMSASTSPWKIVLLHHAPYSSANHGNNSTMQWDYAGWGADAVMAGHDHTYERISQNGIPYFVNGLGGRSPYSFDAPISGSEVRYNADHGAMIIDASAAAITFQFLNTSGTSIDSYTIGQPVDTTGPTSELHTPLDNGASDFDATVGTTRVNQAQPAIDIHLHDITAIDDATVTDATVAVTRDGNAITAGTDYSFSYDAANDMITLTSLGGDFGDGVYVITLSGGGAATIVDTVGNAMNSQSLTVEIDTTIQPPVTVSFQDGVNNYSGTVDTYVTGDSTGSSFGSATTLEVDDGTGDEQTLIRFDDIFGGGAGQIPIGVTIQSATLEVVNSNGGGNPNMHRMLTAWSGSSRWNSLGAGVSPNGVEAIASVDGSLPGSIGTASVDVTAALLAWASDPSSNLGWAFLPTSSDGVDTHSSEATTIVNRPKLTVTYVGGGVNVAPIANDDVAGVNAGGSVSIAVLGNDTDANGDTISVGQVSNLPSNGTIVINANNTITYTPNSGFAGSDSFTYIATDGVLNSSEATVSLSVGSATDNVISVIASDAFAVEVDSTGTFVFARTGDAMLPVTVNYTIGGTATSGTDFDALSGTVTIAAGETSASVVINALDDSSSDGTETVTLSVAQTAVYDVDLDTATLNIRDQFNGAGVDALFPLSETLFLNSLPDARHTIYLDFFGGNYNGGSTIVDAYDTDGNVSVLSDQELSDIQDIWIRAAEDFLPFNVNVTTEDPGDAALRNTGGSDLEWGARILIGDSGSLGFAISGGGFASNNNNAGFVSGDGDNRVRASGISHEVGHALGLSHDGVSGDNYYNGHAAGIGTWMTLMGTSVSGFSQWDRGSYIGSNNSQDDLAIITNLTNGFGYRPDDHTNSATTATPLVSIGGVASTQLGEGIVEQNTDFDLFSFSVTGGVFNFSADPAVRSPNLDVGLSLFDSAMNLIADGSLIDNLSASLNDIALAAGDYFVQITGTGNRTWADGYDDYGSLGKYFVRITEAPVVVTFQQGVNGYTGAVDTWLDGGSAATDHSSNATLQIDGDSGIEQTLLRFENLFGGGTGQIPSNAVIESATLNFNVTDPGNDPNLHEMLINWNDTDTWTSLTGGVNTNNTEASSTIIGSLDASTGSRSMDVTASLEAWLADPSANHGWVFASTGNGGVDLSSSEAATIANRPQLSVAYRIPGNPPPANNAPVAANDSATTSEDNAVSITVQSNDSDPDGDPLTTSVVTQPTSGTAVVNANGTITYTPDDDYNGADSFTYRVNDGSLNSNTATVSLTVAAINDAPAALNDTAATDANTAVTIAVLGNDTDIDGDTLTVGQVSSLPSNGTLVINANNTITYTPNTGFVGSDSFTYIATDGALNSNAATVSITVNDVNFAPTAVNDSATVNEDGSISIAVLTNDSDPDGDAITPSVVTNPTNGSVTINANGTITYTPTANYNGADSFTYLVSDDSLNSNIATVSITVIAAPTFSLNDTDYAPGEVIVATFGNGPGNATDWIGIYAAGDIPGTNGSTAWYYTNGTRTAGGSLTAGVVTLDSASGAGNLADGTYFAVFLENNGYTELASRVTFTVTTSNAAPVASNDSASVNEDGSITIAVLSNDSDPDGDAITPSVVTNPANGSVTVNTNGTVTYTPDANFNGTDSFTYRLSDGEFDSNTATVNINITSVNDAPTAVDDFFSTDFETLLNIAPASVLDNDSDMDGDGMSVDSITQPANGTVSMNGDGSFSYTPDTDFVGNDTFTYTLTDGALTSQATVTITVTEPVDDHGELTDATATLITLNGGDTGNGSASGTFEMTGDRDMFRVVVTDGVLSIDLDGINGLDTYLRVYDFGGTQIASNDDGGPGLSSSLTIDVSAGTFYISAGSYSDAYAGDFMIDVEHRGQGTSTFQQGVDGYSASSDTFLTGDYPTFSYGDWTVNEIDLSSSGDHEHSLLQFDEIFGSAPGQIPFGSEIVSATLTLYVSNGGNQVVLHRMLTPWDDSVTWAGMGAGIQANGVEAAVTPDAWTSSYTSSGWTDIDVTASLSAWMADPSSNHGWAMLPTGTNGVDFYSTNNVSYWVPRISVDYLLSDSDLHADSPDSTATILDVNSGEATAFGTFETAGDRDVFQFVVTQTTIVTIDLGWTGAGNFVDTYLRLYGGERDSDWLRR